MVWWDSARSWISFQNAPRAMGSTPEVGSSRNSTGGSCRMGEPSASPCFPAPAPGQRARQCPPPLREVGHFEHVVLARRAPFPRHVVHAAEEVDVLFHRQIVVEREPLRHVDRKSVV